MRSLATPHALDARGRGWSWLSRCGPALESLVALACAIVISGLVLLLAGHDPVDAFGELVRRSLLRSSGLQEVVVRAVPLLLAGLAVLAAAEAGLWNIGVDGQVLVGAMGAAVAGSWLDAGGRPLLWLAAIGFGALGGVAWMAVPALLRMKWGINEIVTTIMFNSRSR